MVQIDLPLSLAAGGTLAVAAVTRYRGRPDERRRIFLGGLTFQGLALTPAVLYYLVAFPDWDTMYFFRDVGPGPLLVAFVAAASFAAFAVGFSLCAEWLEDGLVMRAYGLTAAAWLLVAGIPLVLWNRFVHVGTVEQFANGEEMTVLLLHPGFLLTTLVAGVVIAFAGWRLIAYIDRGPAA